MFGYVKVYEPELKVKELALYKAVYCGLCKSMGRYTGVLSRLTLSYDMTYLAIVRMAMENTGYTLEKRRCIVHPLKKRGMVKQNAVLEYCARASALLTFGKLEDDVKDTRGIKRLFCKTARLLFKRARNKAGMIDLYEKMVLRLDELAGCENEKTASVDIPSDIFGNLVAEFLSYGLQEENKAVASTIGFYAGKWIYTIDALDDMEKDRKSGSYNPFCLIYKDGLTCDGREMIKGAFVSWLSEIERALDLIDYTDDTLKGIVYNILYCGMKYKSDEITERAICSLDENDKE